MFNTNLLAMQPLSQMSKHPRALSLGLLSTGVFVLAAFAQTPTPPFRYEVASVKTNTSGTNQVRISGVGRGGRVTVTNASLRMMITLAYKIKNFQLAGSGPVLDSDRYDIDARPPEGKFTEAQSMEMFQSLLADRFQLKLHRESKEMPVYALLSAKSGLKIEDFKDGSCEEFKPGSPPPGPPVPGQAPKVFCGNFMMGPNTLIASKTNMPAFVDGLSNTLGRTVIDKTGFTGAFNVRLEFTRDGVANFGTNGPGTPGAAAPGPPPDDSSRPTIFTALQEQLGLRLEAQKAPVEMIVVDHMEKASEN
jgi:uncharacterized protein (TIGR03435 family)